MRVMDINLNHLLRQYRAHPYEDYPVETPHTGIITFKVEEGDVVEGVSGKWQHKPGTLLFYLERERNRKKIHAPWAGEVSGLRRELDGSFVEAGEQVMSIRHRLGKEEIIDKILVEVLTIYSAPQSARYYLTQDIAAKLEKSGKGVTVAPGDEILIMSLMKRDTILAYDGPEGVIYKVYFHQGDMVDEGAPLLGICAPEKVPYVEKVIQRIRTEWEE